MEHNPSIPDLVEMLSYRRREGSNGQKHFLNKWVKPVMGQPDQHGNFVHIIEGEKRIAFMAHHDTVHNSDHWQKVSTYLDAYGDLIAALPENSKSNCLGADCTTGVWLILHMIKNNIPGVYVVHAAEECGCIGADALVKDHPDWLDDIQMAISFDRYGESSVITHQSWGRSTSDTFGNQLAALLGGNYKLDPGGVYTDSASYMNVVSECTNISVGYDRQHSKRETQNLTFAQNLANKLVKIDWSSLTSHRDPFAFEYDDHDYYGVANKSKGKRDVYESMEDRELERIVRLMTENPYEVAAMLIEWGITFDTMVDELKDPVDNVWRYYQ